MRPPRASAAPAGRRTLGGMRSPSASRRLAMPASGPTTSRRGGPIRRRAVGRPSRLSVLVLVSGLLLGLLSGIAGAQDEGSALVEVLEVDGIIDQTISDYVIGVIDDANDSGAEVVVLQLDTPGGLGESMDRITEAITTSRVPVVVWVGPSGAQAASAGTYIGYAGHLLAMAPGTLMGAATPIALDGSDLASKVGNVAAAWLVELAELRGRDTDFAERAVFDAAVVVAAPPSDQPVDLPEDAVLPEDTSRDAVEVLGEAELVDRGIIDFMAATLPDVLRELDGREVTIAAADGGTETRALEVDTVSANVRFNNLGLAGRILHTVASPTLAYLLIIGGALSMLFEVFQPGFGVAGVSGFVLFGLGLYGLSVLPVRWLAFGLIVIGLIALAVDLAIGGLGVLTAGGTVSLFAGSILLFTGPDLLRVSPWVIAAVTVFNVIFFVGIMTTVLRAQGNQAMAGAEGLVGETGVVRSMLNPEGHIFVAGALWRARAPKEAGKIKTGTHVRIVGLNDSLTLDVEPVDAPVEASS
jgi:membrane-bound serine protease (ClpP class)